MITTRTLPVDRQLAMAVKAAINFSKLKDAKSGIVSIDEKTVLMSSLDTLKKLTKPAKLEMKYEVGFVKFFAVIEGVVFEYHKYPELSIEAARLIIGDVSKAMGIAVEKLDKKVRNT